MRRKFFALAVAFVVAVSAVLMFITFAGETNSTANESTNPQTMPVKISVLSKISEFRKRLYAKSAKAVVAIESIATRRAGKVRSGSGFFISEDGLILTSLLNIDLRDKTVKITLFNGETAVAKVVSRDARNACALLKLAQNVKVPAFLEFADSRTAKLAEPVFVIANTFDEELETFEPVMSAGEITGFYRPVVLDTGKDVVRFRGLYRGPVIETSCAINDGSFGAPLLNTKGEVLAVVCKAISYARWLGTAIPIHQIKLNLENLKNSKPGKPAKIRFTVEQAQNNRLKISKLFEDARYNNIKPGDVILRVDNEIINGSKLKFEAIINILPLGARVYFTLERAGKIIRTAEFLE